jgi:hypothetical protein
MRRKTKQRTGSDPVCVYFVEKVHGSFFVTYTPMEFTPAKRSLRPAKRIKYARNRKTKISKRFFYIFGDLY